MTFKSSFFRYLNAMAVSEIGAKLIDLSDVECRCREGVGVDELRRLMSENQAP